MSSTNRHNVGSKLKSSKRLPMTSELSCGSPMADRKCRQLQSSIAERGNRRSRGAPAQVTMAPNAARAIKFIWQSILWGCPYQKFHPTLGEVGVNMLICDY